MMWGAVVAVLLEDRYTCRMYNVVSIAYCTMYSEYIYIICMYKKYLNLCSRTTYLPNMRPATISNETQPFRQTMTCAMDAAVGCGQSAGCWLIGISSKSFSQQQAAEEKKNEIQRTSHVTCIIYSV